MALNQAPNHLHLSPLGSGPLPPARCQPGAVQASFWDSSTWAQFTRRQPGSVEVGDSKGEPKEVAEVLMFSDEIRSNLPFEQKSGQFW